MSPLCQITSIKAKQKAWALSSHKSSPLSSFAIALSTKRSLGKPRHHTELKRGYKLSLGVNTYLCFQAPKAIKPNLTVLKPSKVQLKPSYYSQSQA